MKIHKNTLEIPFGLGYIVMENIESSDKKKIAIAIGILKSPQPIGSSVKKENYPEFASALVTFRDKHGAECLKKYINRCIEFFNSENENCNTETKTNIGTNENG